MIDPNESNSNIIKFFEKYKEIVFYGIFGVLTTLVNILAYWLMAHPLAVKTVPSSVAAWIVAVTFAFLTNRKWVFNSQADTVKLVAKEAMAFYVCRLATGVLDWVFMYITVDIMHFNDIWMKVIANIIVIVMNYIASKFYIFKQKKGNKHEL